MFLLWFCNCTNSYPRDLSSSFRQISHKYLLCFFLPFFFRFLCLPNMRGGCCRNGRSWFWMACSSLLSMGSPGVVESSSFVDVESARTGWFLLYPLSFSFVSTRYIFPEVGDSRYWRRHRASKRSLIFLMVGLLLSH